MADREKWITKSVRIPESHVETWQEFMSSCRARGKFGWFEIMRLIREELARVNKEVE